MNYSHHFPLKRNEPKKQQNQPHSKLKFKSVTYIKKEKTSEENALSNGINSMLYYALPKDALSLPDLNIDAIPMPTV